MKANSQLLRFLPPTLDQSMLTIDVMKARQASAPIWRTTTLPAGFHNDLARLWSSKVPEIGAYDQLWHRYASVTSDESLRDEVGKFYTVAKNIPTVLVEAAARSKSAAYWVAQNRQYRATREELASKKPNCPRCSARMRRTTYKMQKGSKHKLFGCPQCLFLIKHDDLLAPDGAAVVW
jgi:ribosomal protein S27AE